MNCTCYDEVSEKLKAEGLAISYKCAKFRLSKNKLSMALGFPLQPTEGKRLKSNQPSIVFISYCPFCGKSAKEPEEQRQQPA